MKIDISERKHNNIKLIVPYFVADFSNYTSVTKFV